MGHCLHHKSLGKPVDFFISIARRIVIYQVLSCKLPDLAGRFYFLVSVNVFGADASIPMLGFLD